MTSDTNSFPQRIASIVYYDFNWQFPAITEKHAFLMAKKLLPSVDGLVYLAFPWATYFDCIDRGRKEATELKKMLFSCLELIKPGEKIVTVCQHILMIKHSHLFSEIGISTVFWSHAIKDQAYLPNNSKIEIKPFPLFPVQIQSKASSQSTRKYLYSFVGAKSNQYYLTQSRAMIINSLSKHDDGIIISRDQWHYNRIVYDHQITKKIVDDSSALINQDYSAEFLELLNESIFSICPSGTGPNSIRLWESMGAGAIPVILADSYLPPGNINLWNSAVIFIDEKLESIEKIPEILRKVQQDPERLASMRSSIKELWSTYGPGCFIYDVQKMFIEYAFYSMQGRMNVYDVSYISIANQARVLLADKNIFTNISKFNTFGLRCIILAFKDSLTFSKFLEQDPNVKKILNIIFSNKDYKYYKSFDSILKMRKLEFSDSK
jgi:hypothetical protein